MSYGTSLGITLPSTGQTAWGGTLNDILQDIIDVLEQKVTPSGININTTLEMNSQALTEIGYLRFDAQSENLSTTSTIWRKGNDFYLTDGAGNVIQLTSGGAINVASAGGFGGDYVSAGASATYSDSNSSYSFLTPAAAYAAMEVGTVGLHDGSASNDVTLKSPAGLTGSYSVTFPAGTPTATSLLEMNNAGTLACTRNPSIDSLTGSVHLVSRQVINQGTTELTGVLKVLGSVTGSAATFSGQVIGGDFKTSGSYRRDVFSTHYSPSCGQWVTSGSFNLTAGLDAPSNSGAGQVFRFGIPVVEGERILSGCLWVDPASGGGVTASLYAQSGSNIGNNLLVQGLSSGVANQRIDFVPDPVATLATSAPVAFFVEITFGGTGNLIELLSVAKDIP